MNPWELLRWGLAVSFALTVCNQALIRFNLLLASVRHDLLYMQDFLNPDISPPTDTEPASSDSDWDLIPEVLGGPIRPPGGDSDEDLSASVGGGNVGGKAKGPRWVFHHKSRERLWHALKYQLQIKDPELEDL